MENRIEVVRYIRKDSYENPFYYVKSNLHGITLVFDVDYDLEVVSVSWSVCHGVNFSKAAGKQIAKLNNQNLKFHLGLVNDFGSLSSALIAVVDCRLQRSAEHLDYYNYDDYEWFRSGLNRINSMEHFNND